ncbi:probable dihydroxyacetone kinase regulator [Aedoeadaptatus ivorii]|uniref:Probable dihydroxyacetone kinase regulator n=1 Tax=Aedoeadaptatus ivorii TaxID=54006 RepID=A0A3S5AID7_9FIRM|nr:TetR/AcrR family transcriptional regulator [Peptoniphilus ivorii]MDQ0507904.1 AcrR family transcriptional regulator [Peptoniphilus ivorii]VEJ34668.1 probable dihydroxyacetone kinase regulator [Peptoniphilus ivorii]
MAHDTKNALAEALVDCLKTRSLDEITVKEISDQAGVNRQTFYYHFEDIYDLLRYTLDEDISPLFAGGDDLLLKIFEESLKQKKIILNIYHSVNPKWIGDYIMGHMRPFIRKRIEADAPRRPVDPDAAELLVDFFTYSFTGIYLYWVQRNMDENFQVYRDQIRFLLKESLSHTLDSMAKSS